MKLVEHDGPDVVERDIIQQPSQQDAGRHDDQPRVATHAGIEADLVADFPPKLHAAKHAIRRATARAAKRRG